MKSAHWVQKTHLFRSNEYVCSSCGRSYPTPHSSCPGCGARMKKTKYAPSWVDEAESLSAFLDDDW